MVIYALYLYSSKNRERSSGGQLKEGREARGESACTSQPHLIDGDSINQRKSESAWVRERERQQN